MVETKKSKIPFNLKPRELIYVIIWIVMVLVLVTSPIWGKEAAIGVYPAFFVTWLVINAVWAVLHLIYVLVIKKGGEDDDD